MLTSEKYKPSSSMPRRTDSHITKPKRNRRIFSCLFCREKKLRCNRVQPTCGRCQHLGNVCNYVSATLRLENLASEHFKDSFPFGLVRVSPKNDLLTDFALNIPKSSILRPHDTSTTAPKEHIAGLLDPRLFTESTLSLNREFWFSPRLSYQSETHHLERPSNHKDAVLYRSGTSKPRFYGPSAAISVIHSTPMILREVCYVLNKRPHSPHLPRRYA